MDFFELLKVILLGVVEGITEWLPISSTGHMLLVDEFIPLNMSESFKEMFFVVIQFGAILAVVVLFWNKLFPFQIKEHPAVKMDVITMWLKVAAACVPTAVLGFLLDDFLQQHFGSAVSIAVVLILYGIIFIIVETWNKKRTPSINKVAEISYKTAILFGLFQSLAMIPGTSRSGATIIGALLIGVSRIMPEKKPCRRMIKTLSLSYLLKFLRHSLQDYKRYNCSMMSAVFQRGSSYTASGLAFAIDL